MIPEQFKQNIDLNINVDGHGMQVAYRYYWLDKTPSPGNEPLVSHMEFHSAPGVISHSGYLSHFFHTDVLKTTPYKDINELVTGIAEHFFRNSIYYNPVIAHQLKLF